MMTGTGYARSQRGEEEKKEEGKETQEAVPEQKRGEKKKEEEKKVAPKLQAKKVKLYSVARKDRKSVVEGKCVDLGGRRMIKKKKQQCERVECKQDDRG